MPVHVSGRAAPMAAILDIARRHNLFVVEDAAESFLSRHAGHNLGTLGHAGCLSFSPNKIITTGQGGAILTNDERLQVRARELKDQGRPVRGTGGDDVHDSVGYNFKLTNLQAALGLAQLGYLERRMARLKQIYRTYAHALNGLEGITLPGFNLDEGESPQWVDAIVERRDELDGYLLERNVHCRRFWFPLHTQKALPTGGRQVSEQHPHLPAGALAPVCLFAVGCRRHHRVRAYLRLPDRSQHTSQPKSPADATNRIDRRRLDPDAGHEMRAST